MHTFGTPEIFSNHGFVEPMPQRWIINDLRLKFDINHKKDGSGELEVDFFRPPSQEGLGYLKDQLGRLEEFLPNLNGGAIDDIPDLERDFIRQYYDAMVTAFELAQKSAVRVSDEVWDLDEDDWSFPDEVDDDDEEMDVGMHEF